MSRLKSFLIRRIKSFSYAINGLKFIIKTQVNFIIHLIAATTAVILGIILRINTCEWAILTLTIGLVLFAETVNTVIEQIMDFVSPEFNKKVGLIKDLAAGAVLVTAIISVIVGMIIFLPKIIALFN